VLLLSPPAGNSRLRFLYRNWSPATGILRSTPPPRSGGAHLLHHDDGSQISTAQYLYWYWYTIVQATYLFALLALFIYFLSFPKECDLAKQGGTTLLPPYRKIQISVALHRIFQMVNLNPYYISRMNGYLYFSKDWRSDQASSHERKNFVLLKSCNKGLYPLAVAVA
jgi:hypothetical protein